MSRCTCLGYAEWMSRMNGEPTVGYYRNPRCPEHQGHRFPDPAMFAATTANRPATHPNPQP